ncbi:MAG: ABC transporter permease [Acidobacteria bacterium]|nr:ABC transporter permease [Acidobacteriota bacterium]
MIGTETHQQDGRSAVKMDPEKKLPVLVIRRGSNTALTDIREIWERRELVYMLIWRDLKLRYKQTILGVSWAIVQPTLMTIVFAVFFGMIVQVPSDGIPYAVFAYSGLLIWSFFSQALMSGSMSLSGNANLINKIYFPRSILPLASVCVRLVDLGAAAIPLWGLMLYYKLPFTWSMLWCPLLIAQLALLSFALSAVLAALQLRFRDVGSIMPILIQAWLFASPVVYPASIVGNEWRKFYFLNPMAGIVENWRAALFGTPIDRSAMMISGSITLILSLICIRWFYALSRNMGDVY